MKQFIALFILFCWSSLILYSQNTTIHIVTKGETLKTIAKIYGVSQEAIIEANPTAKTYVYVGMKLTIPKTTKETEISSDNSSTKEAKKGKNEQLTKTAPPQMKEVQSPCKFLSFLEKVSMQRAGVYLFFFQGGMGVGAEVSPIKNIPVGASVEYWFSSTAKNYSFSADLAPVIPIAFNGQLAINPIVGLGVCFLKTNDGNNKNKVYLRLHPQICYTLPWINQLHISAGYLYNTYSNTAGNFTIGASYEF